MRALVAAGLAAACLAASLAHADSSVPQPGGGSATLASLERTACSSFSKYGPCPIYTVTVLRDGTVRWQVRQFDKVTFQATEKLSVATVAALVDAFKRADFFALADYYGRDDAVDCPSAITTFADSERKKSIHHIHGYGSAPEQLKVLEEEFDKIVGTPR